MRYSSDWRSLAFVVAAFLMVVIPFAVAPSAAFWSTPWEAALWMGFECLLCFCACVINHNHVHLPIFRRPAANEAFNILITLAKGHTSTTVTVPHNLNHHVHSGSPHDWIRVGLAGEGWGVWRLARFIVRASRSMAVSRRSPEAPRLAPALRSSMRRQQLALALFIAGLAWLDWRKVIPFALVPWGIAMAALVAVNLLQHDACDPGSEIANSRNFVGALDNWLFFNNGYHTAHHLWPSMHWSLLPERHRAELALVIPRELDRRSLAGCVARDYCLGSAPPGPKSVSR